MHIRPSLDSRAKFALTGLTAVLIFAALTAWALSSPVGSSPDEDFHLTSSWCGHGARDGVCEDGPSSATRTVPAALLTAPCFIFKPNVSASCQGAGFAPGTSQMTVTERGNFTNIYPPVFYFAMSFFVGNDISKSVIAMRLANAALFVLLVTALYLALPEVLRRPLLWGTAVSIVPLGMFLIPSVNPSGWAISSAATLLVSTVGYLTTNGRRRIVLAALAFVSVVLGAGSRGDAALYSLAALAGALVVSCRRERRFVRVSLYPVALGVLAIVSYLRVGQADFATTGLVSQTDLKFSLDRVALLIMTVPDLWVGAFGKWGLGWLDTYLTPIVWVTASAIFFGTAFAALRQLDRRRGIVLAVYGIAIWVIPLYMLYLSGAIVGEAVQPRYILPLLVLFASAAMLPVRGVPFALSSGQRWLTVVGLAGANSVALHDNIRRYVNGADAPSLNLNTGVKWWWGIPISPDVVWLIGTIAFAGGLALVSLALRPPVAVPVNGVGEGFATVLVPDGRDPSERDGEAPGNKSIGGRAPAGLAPVKGEGVEQSDG